MNFEEDKDLSYIEKQTILYFKLHFKIDDMIEDLKVFVSKEYSFGVERVEFRNIYGYVNKLYFKLKEMNYIKSSMQDFLTNMFQYRENTISPIGILEQMRSEIQWMKCEELDLGDPDFSLLPKKEEFLKSNYDKYIENCERSYTVPLDFDSWNEIQISK